MGPQEISSQKRKSKEKKNKRNNLRYSFEILENLWKERTKCTAGIKQMHQKLKQIFLVTFHILWLLEKYSEKTKSQIKVMTHLPWGVPFQKTFVISKRRNKLLWSTTWETRLMRWLNNFLIIWVFLILVKKFDNLCDIRIFMLSHTPLHFCD